MVTAPLRTSLLRTSISSLRRRTTLRFYLRCISNCDLYLIRAPSNHTALLFFVVSIPQSMYTGALKGTSPICYHCHNLLRLFALLLAPCCALSLAPCCALSSAVVSGLLLEISNSSR